MNIRQYLRSGILVALVAFSGMAQAVPVEVIKIGTWNTATGAGNPLGVGGPGMATGQKYVIKINYDDTSTVETRDVVTAGFADSGQDMSVIELTGGSNTLDVFVPMEGLDTSTPFIYTQNDSNHFDLGFGTPEPTLNFVDGSDVTDTANIIGVEFEGDLVTGAGNNLIELYNAAADATSPINQVGQVLNFGVGTAIRQVGNSLTDSEAVVNVGSDNVAFDANMAAQTANVAAMGNDLGAGRSDTEDFLDATWDVSGTTATSLVRNEVAIQVELLDSGLTSTIDTATWNVDVTEQMTGISSSASGQVMVSYINDAPSSTLSATATASGYDFAYSSLDADLVVNTLIAGFEILTYSVEVDGVATTLFDSLISTGSLSLTELALFNAFGEGVHSLGIIVTDLAGAISTASADFTVGDISPVPVPPAFALMLTALGLLGVTGFRKRNSNTASSV